MEISTLIILLMVIPLFAGVFMACFPSKHIPQAFYETVHFLSVLAVALLAVYLVVVVMTSGNAATALGNWFRLDSLGSIFVALIGVVGFLTGWYSLSYIRHDVADGKMTPGQVKRYYVFFNLFIFTMLLAALSNNIIMMWAAIEATTLATVFLVGAYDTKTALEAAWKYIIVCTCGVAFGLYGTVLVYANAAAVMPDATQAVFWTELLPNAGSFDAMLIQIAFVFAAVGFGTKAGLFPMHTWLPDAHSEAPSPVSALLSGVLIKCAILIVIRFYILAIQTIGSFFPQLIMLILGIASVVVAVFGVFSQDDIKRKLAYSSCENIGVVALCLGFGGPLGIAAALLHCILHGITKSFLFCLSGNLLMKYGTRDLRKIRGVIQVAPATAVLFIIGLLAISAFPPFAMFVSEVLAFISGVVTGYLWVVILMGIVLTVVIAAFVRVATGSILSKPSEDSKIEKKDVGPAALIPEIIMACVVIWFGVAMPQPIISGVEEATTIVMQVDDTEEMYDTPLFKDIFGHNGDSQTDEIRQ